MNAGVLPYTGLLPTSCSPISHYPFTNCGHHQSSLDQDAALIPQLLQACLALLAREVNYDLQHTVPFVITAFPMKAVSPKLPTDPINSTTDENLSLEDTMTAKSLKAFPLRKERGTLRTTVTVIQKTTF